MCETKPDLPSVTETSDGSDSEKVSRPALLKFWEINNSFKCPVIGMCLSLSEQKQLLKKAGISIKKKSPFEIHETLVASSDTENRLSRRVGNLLDRKFGKEAASLLALGPKKFLAHWRAVFEADDCLAALWAAAASPDLPPEGEKEIFGDVHMTMHWSADQSIKLKQKIARQRDQIDFMEQTIKDASGDRRTLRKENNRLRRRESDLTKRLLSLELKQTKLKKTITELNNEDRQTALEQENLKLQEKLDAYSLKLKTSERQVASLSERNRSLSVELERQRDMTEILRKETRELVMKYVALNRCDTACPSYDLCQKRVLIVGGITRMESLYREFIEGSGGIFEYHNGYMKNGVKQLESRLKRADVVLCPVSCNSHAACSIVKNLAKKHNKTLHMLANSSLNAVSQVIGDASSSRGCVN